MQPFNACTLQCWSPWMLALSDSPNNFLFVIIYCVIFYYSITKQTNTYCTNNPKKIKTPDFFLKI